jgi:K+-transporting ATPase A subunit
LDTLKPFVFFLRKNSQRFTTKRGSTKLAPTQNILNLLREKKKEKKMEWRKYYLDMILVPLGFMIIIGYHVWLWHKVRTQPSSTIIGINTHGRRSWVPSMLKV